MNRQELMHYWRVEVMGRADRPISVHRLLRMLMRKEDAHFLFWFRLAQYLHRKPRGLLNYKKIGARIRSRLLRLHNIDIMLGAEIGPNLQFSHRLGIVIADRVRMGKNAYLRQNTTIGIRSMDQKGLVYIGDNVEIGAHTCIIGDDLHIGDNVVIGAMAFVNSDIPSNSTCYTRHVAMVSSRPPAGPDAGTQDAEMPGAPAARSALTRA